MNCGYTTVRACGAGAILTLLCLRLFGQSGVPASVVGPALIGSRDEILEQFIGERSDASYALHLQPGRGQADTYIVRRLGARLEEQGQFGFETGKGKSRRSVLHAALSGESVLLFFAQRSAAGTSIFKLALSTHDLAPKGQPEVVSVWEGSASPSEITVEEGHGHLVFHENSARHATAGIAFLVTSANGKVLRSGRLDVTAGTGQYVPVDWSVNFNGVVGVLAQVIPDGHPEPAQHVFVHLPLEGMPKSTVLNPDGMVVRSARVRANTQGDFCVAGLIRRSSSGIPSSAFSTLIDGSSGEVITTSECSMQKGFLTPFDPNASRRNAVADPSHTELRQLVELPQGGSILLAEQYTATEIGTYPAYLSGDILAWGLDEAGTLTWCTKLPRRTTAATPHWSSFAVYCASDRVYLISNDSRRNLSTNPTRTAEDAVIAPGTDVLLTTLDSHGNVHKELLFKSGVLAAVLCPQFSQRGAQGNALLLYAKYARSQQFIRLEWSP